MHLSAQEFGVNGYPTLKFFGENKRRPLAYSGARDADAMADFVLAKWAALQLPPEVRQQGHARCWVAALYAISRSTVATGQAAQCATTMSANSWLCAGASDALSCNELGNDSATVKSDQVRLDTACVPVCIARARITDVGMRGAAQVRELVDQTAMEDECLGHGARPAKKLWCVASHRAAILQPACTWLL